MTNKQAVEEIRSIMSDMPSMECKDWIEAMFMAINALKQLTDAEDSLHVVQTDRDKLIKDLKTLADDPELDMLCTLWDGECRKALRKAADTIETLSAKLQATNMEQSSMYYHGGWVPVDERLPEENERDLDYMVTVKCDTWEQSEVMSMVWETTVVRGKKVSRWKWRDRNVPSGWNVIAWQPRPREYRWE